MAVADAHAFGRVRVSVDPDDHGTLCGVPFGQLAWSRDLTGHGRAEFVVATCPLIVASAGAPGADTRRAWWRSTAQRGATSPPTRLAAMFRHDTTRRAHATPASTGSGKRKAPAPVTRPTPRALAFSPKPGASSPSRCGGTAVCRRRTTVPILRELAPDVRRNSLPRCARPATEPPSLRERRTGPHPRRRCCQAGGPLATRWTVAGGGSG